MPAIVRVGQGYDLHRLEAGRKLMLGGVEVPFEKGMAAHSDGDVVLHALIDAMLGAAGLPDIGEQYPNTDLTYKNADSSHLVSLTKSKVAGRGFVVVNVDLTIMAEQPRLKDYKKPMKDRIAQLLGLGVNDVGLKAKTGEGVDAVGKGEAIACHCVVGLAHA